MKRISKYWKRILVPALAALMMSAWVVPCTFAAEEPDAGKYVKDVTIAFGKTEEEAAAWLEDNGWEPVKGGPGAGLLSAADGRDAAVLGIRRTDDRAEAVTDLAVMNGTESGNPDGDRLVLYAARDTKSAPILADSLTLQQGGGAPGGRSRSLYFFSPGSTEGSGALTGTPAGGNEAAALFWNTEEDVQAPSAASAFTGGQLALIGTVGLVVGVLGATMVLLPKRKKIWVDDGGNM